MLNNDLSSDLKDLVNKKLYRQRQLIEEIQEQNIKINNRWVLNFSSNDYLGLTQNKDIKTSIINGIKKYGNGSGSSHLISGHHLIHDEIEKLIAKNLQFNKSILFTSGFAANIGVITSICSRNDVIFSDKLNHASLNEAALLSKSKFVRYRHLDLSHLEQLLQKHNGRRKLIVSDAVFSMDGDLIDLPKLIDLCEKYDAYLYIDDAHGFGVLGKNGQGTLEYYYPKLDLSSNRKKRLIYMVTLGKSVGISGAFVLASNQTIKYLVQKAKTYIYTTALSPALANGIFTSLTIILKDKKLRKRILQNIKIFRKTIKNKILLTDSITPIQPILINDTKASIKLSQKLLDKGFYVPVIRPPTVPKNTSRLRISISALHKEQNVKDLAELINLNL
ncbi:MAG: 8-amino-7-oxononanoate synthase [Nitrosomonadales bacterium]|nr:8-amino-7-oxononanoate synthase [Nitrosomonadales bacterium]|tara:strand:+ start:1029 stop:2198 length:1170 start_codon:yes stop_codon:yes gene_type:complete